MDLDNLPVPSRNPPWAIGKRGGTSSSFLRSRGHRGRVSRLSASIWSSNSEDTLETRLTESAPPIQNE